MVSARPVALSGLREASSNTERLARSIISVWSRSSSTAKRAGTLASNGNCCSSRVHSAWMVCTFRPPGVSSAQAKSLRASLRSFALGCAIPASRIACVQRLVIERDPMAEGGKHPLRHIGGGGFRERDAENFLRRNAVKQQPDHPLYQHMGFAGAGIGRHESGCRRVGRARLCRAHGIGNDAGRFHHSSYPQAAGRGPFLDAGEIVIRTVAVGPHRQVQRGIGLVFVIEFADQLLELLPRVVGGGVRATAAYRCCLIFSSSDRCSPGGLLPLSLT